MQFRNSYGEWLSIILCLETELKIEGTALKQRVKEDKSMGTDFSNMEEDQGEKALGKN